MALQRTRSTNSDVRGDGYRPAAGCQPVIFGDLFLEDIRAYREASLEGTGMTPVFPLWHRPTAEVARQILASGIRAVITCVDPTQRTEGHRGPPV